MYPTYDKNPFTIETRHIRSYVAESIDKNTGEISAKMKKGDFEEHVRIFPSAYDDFKLLNSMAIQILGIVFKSMHDDYVRLNIADITEELGVSSRSTTYRGVIDLIDKDFIARKAGSDIYYINPAKIFKGSRAKWFDKNNGI